MKTVHAPDEFTDHAPSWNLINVLHRARERVYTSRVRFLISSLTYCRLVRITNRCDTAESNFVLTPGRLNTGFSDHRGAACWNVSCVELLRDVVSWNNQVHVETSVVEVEMLVKVVGKRGTEIK